MVPVCQLVASNPTNSKATTTTLLWFLVYYNNIDRCERARPKAYIYKRHNLVETKKHKQQQKQHTNTLMVRYYTSNSISFPFPKTLCFGGKQKQHKQSISSTHSHFDASTKDEQDGPTLSGRSGLYCSKQQPSAISQ